MKLKKGTIRALLYMNIAALTSLLTDISAFKTFGEITSIGIAVIIINFVLQALIAWRAYLDQTLSRDENDNKQQSQRTPRPIDLLR